MWPPEDLEVDGSESTVTASSGVVSAAAERAAAERAAAKRLAASTDTTLILDAVTAGRAGGAGRAVGAVGAVGSGSAIGSGTAATHEHAPRRAVAAQSDGRAVANANRPTRVDDARTRNSLGPTGPM